MLADTVYRELQPQERLRATISALARGDEEEQDRLIRTCERKLYKMPDAEFSSPLKGVSAMAAMHYLLVMRLLVNFLLADKLIAATERAAETDPSKLECRGYEVAMQLWDVSVACFKGRQEAWQEFCRRTKLEPSELSAVLQIGLEDDRTLELTERAILADETPTDVEVRDHYLDTLLTAWKDMTHE